jgi:hypothetical protein
MDQKVVSITPISPIFSIILWPLFYKPNYVYKEKRPSINPYP